MLVGLSSFEKKKSASGNLPVTSTQKSMLPCAFFKCVVFTSVEV